MNSECSPLDMSIGRVAGSAGSMGFLARLWNSAVVLSWGMNGLRLASGVLLLPLLLYLLPTNDLGFYYVLLSLQAIVPLLDFGVAVSVDRSVSYAMGGARQLTAHGLDPDRPPDGRPNYALVWKLAQATRVFYGLLALLVLFVLGGIGTGMIRLGVHETSRPMVAWLAWGLALSNVALDIYAGWWNVLLRGMNQVLASARILFVGYALKLAVSCVLLLLGAGLASVFAAGILSSFLIRWWSRRTCLRLLPPEEDPRPGRAEVVALLRILWPNSWRVGLQLFSGYLGSNANALICFKLFGLAANAQYGLSLQVVTIIQGMAMVWTSVKWPVVGQCRARRDDAALRHLLWARVWLQVLTYCVLAAGAFFFGPSLLRWMGSNKELMAASWFLLLLANGLLESLVGFWTTLLSTENRVPSLWPMVTTNVVNLLLVLLLTQSTDLGLGAFAVVPLVTGSLFNYWYWPKAGARSLQTTWLRYTFSRPS